MLASLRSARTHLTAIALSIGAGGCVYEPAGLPPQARGALLDAAEPPGDSGPDAGPEGGNQRPDAGAVAADRPDRPTDLAATLAADAARDETGPAPADAGPACTERTRLVVAIDGVSLDHGPPPRDPPRFDPLELSVGNLHDHDHDVGAWMKFPLDEIPPRARLHGARLFFTAQLDPPTLVPDISLVYSRSDGWTRRSTDPAEVPRGTAVGGGSGPLRRGRQSAQLDLATYGALWAGDLSDGFLTLGLRPADDPSGAFRYATVQSSVPGNGDDPALELTTCE